MGDAPHRPNATTRARGALLLAVVAALLLAACGGDDPALTGPTVGATDGVPSLEVSSPTLTDGGTMPVANTCDGDGAMPTITWSGLPSATAAVAVLIADPDAPRGTYTHLFAVLPGASRTSLSPETLEDADVARNSAGDAGWAPACPPEGDSAHRYQVTVLALAELPAIDDGTALDTAVVELQKVDVLARGGLTVTYGR